MISFVFVLYWNIIFVYDTIDVDIMLLLILCCWWGLMASDVTFVFVSRMYTMPIFVFDPRIYKIFVPFCTYFLRWGANHTCAGSARLVILIKSSNQTEF